MILERNRITGKLTSAQLYCITCPPKDEILPPNPSHPGGRQVRGQNDIIGGYEQMVESACKGGADIVQLREKNLSAKELFLLAQRLCEICHRYEVSFIVNDRIDIALASGADGVHLGQEDLPIAEARKFVSSYLTAYPFASLRAGRLPQPTGFIIGSSTHSLEQALRAQKEGADYVGCGPIFSTPTKPDYRAVGLGLIREYRKHLKIPFVAIGGIEESNLQKVLEAGASCVAVVRAVCGSDDIENAAKQLKKRIMQFGREAGFPDSIRE